MINFELLLQSNFNYQPGDHVGILPCNRSFIVDDLISRLKGVDDPDKPIQLEQLKETHTSNGNEVDIDIFLCVDMFFDDFDRFRC